VAELAFVLPFGEPEEAFFSDALLALLASDARRRGHGVHLVRVYYDGKSRERDQEISARLAAWLGATGADLVVVERLFDVEPLLAHRERSPARRLLQVTRGDSLEPLPGVEHVLGAWTEPMPGGLARRSPRLDELRAAFCVALERFASGLPWNDLPGVAHFDGENWSGARSFEETTEKFPFDPCVDWQVIALGAPPRIWQKTLLGNEGCPFALDPLKNPFYAGVELPTGVPMARLGCAFCHMGGDYEKRSDSLAVASLVEQARYYRERLPDLEAFTLSDQHSIRYLALLMREVAGAGMGPMRWLFPVRADAFVHERARIRDAAAVARAAGQVLEAHLSGFEAFSDVELQRYNKGCTREELIAAVGAMRELAAELPESFEYARAKAHSLILWNPWTTPRDLLESVSTMAEHGLGELFHDIGKNRLRLYRELPIYWAAQRDGALVDAWDDPATDVARTKGYSSDLPWRFLDPRTRVAFDAAALLRRRLGRETELEQLAAAVDYAESGSSADVAAGLDALESVLASLFGPTRAKGLPPRGTQVRAEGLTIGAAFDLRQLRTRARAAAASGSPLLVAGAGLELHWDRIAEEAPADLAVVWERLPELSELRARRVGRASLRLGQPFHEPEAIRGLVRAGVALELRVVPRAGELDALGRWLELATRAGVRTLRLEISLAALGLSELSRSATALASLLGAAAAEGVGVEAAPLAAGLGDLRFAPGLPQRVNV